MGLIDSLRYGSAKGLTQILPVVQLSDLAFRMMFRCFPPSIKKDVHQHGILVTGVGGWDYLIWHDIAWVIPKSILTACSLPQIESIFTEVGT